MSVDLFAFDFTEENNDMMTDERVTEQFKVLQTMFKERRNAYFYGYVDLPNDMMVYIDEFEKRGWIERRGEGINILDQHLKHHTVEEVIGEYKKMLSEVLKEPNISFYEDVLPIINSGGTSVRYKDEETKDEISKAKKEIIKDVVMTLGLKHFIEVPSSRGQKMNVISSKWSTENVLPIIAEKVIPMNDYDEIERYFKEHVFFFGRRDWDKSGYRNDYEIPPYPEFRGIMPSYLEIASLCEAEDIKTIKLILDYSGSCYGFRERESDMKYVYPEGWSYERYQSTLTDKEKELIRKDQERLKRMHLVS